jgi:Zn-finger nucleic acid-binding protein
MVPLRRNGVVVDRCSDCGGVFLDRGELDKIIALERQPVRRWEDDDDDDDFFDRERGHERDREYAERGHDDHGRRRKKRKRSFFEDLFDID